MVSKRALISCLVAISLFISVFIPSAFAQRMVFDDWTAVQTLMPSDEIVITLKTEKEVKGKFLDAGASEVSIERNGKRQSIAKDTIAQIHLVKGKARKGQWALIGAGVGAGTGFAIGQSKNHGFDDQEIYPFVGTLLGAGVGAATGYVFGMSRRKRELIYQGR
jgi:hypothetical protein